VEKELHETESGYKMLFANAMEGILVAELQTKHFLFANPAVCRMLGCKEKEVLQLSVEDIHPKASLDRVLGEFEALARGEKTRAIHIFLANAETAPFFTPISATRPLC